MIPGMMMPMSGLDKGSSLREVINVLGLTTGLKLLLDAGDRASVASASQTKWLDVAGSGYDFNRGSGSGSDSADPTFNGTIGRQSSGEFYSSDGGDYFTYDSANETWMNNLHKNNATFSIAMWINPSSATSLRSLITTAASTGSSPTTAETGVQVRYENIGGTDLVRLLVGKGVPTDNVFLRSVSITLSTSTWNFVSLAVNEGANTCIWNINGTATSGTCTYDTPSSNSAARTMKIGADGEAATPLASNDKVANLAMWEGSALSAANLTALFSATRVKFGV